MGFNDFIRERRYLKNVSSATISWYTHALKWLPNESPSQSELKDAVLRMREKGLKATGCNAAIRAINCYLHWSSTGGERKCGAGCQHPHISQLKEPENILPTLTADQVKRLVNWKPRPKHFYQRRLHLLALLLLDTGCRITEALTLRVRDVDMENMLITGGQRPEAKNSAILVWSAKGSAPLYDGLWPEARFPALRHPPEHAG